MQNTRSMIHKGQAIRDDIKIARKFMGQLIANLQNLWDSNWDKGSHILFRTDGIVIVLIWNEAMKQEKSI